jgi:hypothetical protein
VLSSNGWGTVSLGAGTSSTVAGNAVAPTAISRGALPPSASAMLGNLSLAHVTLPAGGTSSGLGLAIGGAAQTTTQWVILGVVAAGIIAVIAANQDDDAPAAAPTPSHH